MYEKNLAYETVPVDLVKKEQKRPEFLKMNPYGKVPVLVDGDLTIYESCIINEYLEEKYPDVPLMPKDPGLRAKIRIMIDYGVNHTLPPYDKIRNEMLKPQEDRNSDVIAEAINEITLLLNRFEQDLAQNRTYLAGEFSLIDVALIPRFLRLEMWGALSPRNLPRLSRWLETMRTRSSIQKMIADGMPQF